MERFALRGDFVFADEKRKLEVREDSYLVVDEEGRISSLSKTLPEVDRHIEVLNRRGKLILPGMTDLHLHAPQYTYRGMGMDLELLDWLNTYTFPEESRYKDLSYADTAYDIFVEDLFRSYTTRAVIFATIFPESTLLLMDKLEASGLITYVGKLNMDRNAPSFYVEDTGDSLKATRQWIRESRRRYLRTFPILTPRFIPSCSDALMRGLGEIAKEEKVPLQSHLSENRKEIQLVQKLVPEASFYGDAYDRFGTLGSTSPTIMAHCISSSEEELQRLLQRGVYVAHCPGSNLNVSSGIAPVRKMLELGIPVGIGTDVAGGHSLMMPDEMVRAVEVSKMYWRYLEEVPPLDMKDAFAMATRIGGSFFGKVGAFEEGYDFDAVVVDDAAAKTPLSLDLSERLCRSMYLNRYCRMTDKFVKGKKVI